MTRNVKKPRAKTVPAIRKAEAAGETLDRTQLKKLLRAELSRVVRERDELRCYVTGRECPPGAYGPGNGQCAHLIPINQLPPEYRYDPRLCVWLETTIHSDFDGRTHYGKKPANQARVWGILAQRDPELFEFVTSLPKSQAGDKVPIHELRDQLERLRAM